MWAKADIIILGLQGVGSFTRWLHHDWRDAVPIRAPLCVHVTAAGLTCWEPDSYTAA